MDETVPRRIAVLQEQQSAITRALSAMNDGRWLSSTSGADSVEGWLCALNPTWVGELLPEPPLYTLPDVPDEPIDIGAPVNVEWKGTPHYSNGRYGCEVHAIVIHTMAGSLDGCTSWFQNPNAKVSSHYGVGLDGRVHQYVKLTDSSWANGILQAGNQWQYLVGNSINPNYQTVTIETEDRGLGSTAVTDEMYQATLAVCRIALAKYPKAVYLMGHNIISPQSRPQCCGDRWWESGRFQALADELALEAAYA